MGEQISSSVSDADDANNNQVNVDQEYLNPRLQTLFNQPSVAASVARFYQKLQKSHGEVLESLHNGSICLGGDVSQEDFVPILEMLAEEQHFDLEWLKLGNIDGPEQSLVQIQMSDDVHTPAVTVCLGTGANSKNLGCQVCLDVYQIDVKARYRAVNDPSRWSPTLLSFAFLKCFSTKFQSWLGKRHSALSYVIQIWFLL